MAEEKKKEKNPEADAKNWNDRLITEAEAPHKWAESWGQLFDNGVPHEYDKRLNFFEEKLKDYPTGKILPKYGVGAAFKDIVKDHKRKKPFQEGTGEDY